MNLYTFDAYALNEIARRVDDLGVGKASLPILQTLTLAVLAGFFIAFGAMLYTLVMSGEAGLASAAAAGSAGSRSRSGWISLASHRVSGKILYILFPIPAFVALGFEHSVASMYLIPIGMLADRGGIDWLCLARNLLPVTFGNVVGGVSVALIY